MSGNSYGCPHGNYTGDCPVCTGPQSVAPKTCLTDGTPVTDDHKDLKEDGQQKGYVVLTAQEREKGFVRPYRDTYVHVGIRPTHPTRPLNDEEQAQYAEFNYVLYEDYPEDESPAVGRFWTQAQLDGGCKGHTTMGRSIAETYARDPGFYGGTFCVGCSKHLPLEEFVWKGTDIIVGT